MKTIDVEAWNGVHFVRMPVSPPDQWSVKSRPVQPSDPEIVVVEVVSSAHFAAGVTLMVYKEGMELVPLGPDVRIAWRPEKSFPESASPPYYVLDGDLILGKVDGLVHGGK